MPDKPASEKTEQPTPKKLRDGRKKGQVGKSNDVVSTALLISVFLLFTVFWQISFVQVASILVLPMGYLNQDFNTALATLGQIYLLYFLRILSPFIGTVMIVAILANFFQVGPIFAVESIKPNIQKLNPIEGAKKIFSLKNIIEFLKNILKMTVLGFMVYLVLKHMLQPLLIAPFAGLQGVIAMIGPLIAWYCWPIAFIYLVFAVADFFFQKFNFTRDMRMTKDEVKREFKETEGNPEIKGKRKELAREFANSDAVDNTKKSTVLVTNPTHYAIAINYAGKKTLPKVTAKGQGYLAKLMIKAAREANVPIMRNVPLARDLYKHAKINEYIPKDLLGLVAEVIKWVRKKKKEEERQLYGP